MADEIFVGDIGTEIDIEIEEDISTGTNFKIYVQKPDKTEVVWTAARFDADGSHDNNFIRYVIQEGDLDMKGGWRAHPWVEMPDGEWTGLIVKFQVYEKFSTV